MKNSEAILCRDAGVKWVAFTVANDGISVVVNTQNTWVDCLTTAELKTIWNTGSKVKSWKDIRSSFPDVALKLFGPGTDSGTFDFFTEKINGKAKASRSDYLATEDDNVIVQGVEGERGALGYFGFSYYEENASRLKLVKVDSGTGCVAPSVATVQRARTSRSRARSSSTPSARRSSAPSWRATSATSSTTRRRSRRSPATSRSPTAS